MNRYNRGAGAASPPSAPAAPDNEFFTEGNPGLGVPATQPGPWWFHMISEELRAVIVAGGLTPDHTDLSQLSSAIQAMIASSSINIPAGQVDYFAMNAAPTGYLKANGAAISRTAYADLFTAIGTTFGVGDGSTTFNLPDLRGEFLRGWDDGRGIDSGRAFGSAQAHGVNMNGTIEQVMGFNGSALSSSGVLSSSRTASGVAATGAERAYHTITINGGSTETRPRNIALLPCIKY